MSNPLAPPSTNGSVVVTGSLAFDQIMDYPGHFKDHILPDKIHTINLSFLVDDLKKQRGGCAANIAYTLALLGERPRVVAAAGWDFAEYGDWMVARGIDTSGIRIFDGEVTACCFITTDRSDNQITGFHPGAMRRARELSLRAAAPSDTAFCVVAPDDPEAMVRHCGEAREAGLPLIFDPSFQVIAMDGPTLVEAARGAKVVILNDYEFAIFQEKTGVTGSGLHDLAELWVVTLGEKGSEIRLPDGGKVEVPAARAGEVVDPTGAGDAYRGGFVTGLLRGESLAVCGRLGSVAAVYAIEHYGTTSHGYSREEFAERYRENFG